MTVVNQRVAQLDLVYDSFFQAPKTMKEVDKEIGVMRENICWYVKELRKTKRIWMVNKRKCNVTKHVATTWTTNKALIPENPQLSFWNYESSK